MCSLALCSSSLKLAYSLARPLSRTRSNSLTCSRTRSPGFAKPFTFHSLPSSYSTNEWICYVATKFCENTLIGVGDVTAQRNSKECHLMAEFNFRFQFWHLPVFRDLYMCHREKFQWNQIIRGWSKLQASLRLLSWIFEKNVFGPVRTLRILAIDARTKFGENISSF